MKIKSVQFNLDNGYVLWTTRPHIWKDNNLNYKKYNYIITVVYDGDQMTWHSSLKPNKKNALHYVKLLIDQINT